MDKTNSLLEKALAEQAARAACLEAGANADLLAAFIAARTRVSIDGENVRISVHDEAGNPMIANARGDMMTPSLFAASLRTDSKFAAAFPDAAKLQGKGSQAGAGRTISRAAFDALNPAERQRVIARGATVTD